jgi:divalent metal cation (Fe/Co/Zn/Cd) transporter
MRLSLAVGLLMLIGKATAFFVTHSAAIFSGLDATLRPFQASLDT